MKCSKSYLIIFILESEKSCEIEIDESIYSGAIS